MPVIIAYRGQEILVSECDYADFAKRRWHVDSMGYVGTQIKLAERKFVRVSMHRMIMGCTKGDGMTVDHINGNKLDNRRENLRLATIAQNAANRGAPSNNKTGYKGVRKIRGRYVTSICIDRDHRWIGTFDAAEEAYAAYKREALRLAGEFAHSSLTREL